MLELINLDIGYANKRKIIRQINFRLEFGHALVITADNGQGKTTLIKTISGMIPPLNGSIKSPSYPWGIVRVESNGLIPFYNGMENLEFYNSSRINLSEYFKQFFHLPIVQELLKTRTEEMSSGMKQICKLLISLLSENELVLWDEPLKSLSPQVSSAIINLLSIFKKNKIFIICDHNHLPWINFADFKMEIQNGKLASAI